MKKLIAIAAFMAASVGMMEGTAQAWHVIGNVYCDANLNGVIDAGDLPVSGVTVTVAGGAFTGTDTTGNYGAGGWAVFLPDAPGSYQITLAGNTSPVISPTLTFSLTDDVTSTRVDILLDGTGCSELKCWLTAGGVKFNPTTRTQLAEKGPQHNFGGNVNPSCDADPGDGGQWNHVAHGAKLHFQGTAIEVVRCGNVADHPPGSTSPVTPYNFIEFQGTGTLKGIAGNKTDEQVSFFARAEDRNEPGGEAGGNNSGSYVDRYFLRVVDGSGATRLLVDTDGAPATVDPISITGGNLQLHISSCATR
jgi:hypothetical protein